MEKLKTSNIRFFEEILKRGKEKKKILKIK